MSLLNTTVGLALRAATLAACLLVACAAVAQPRPIDFNALALDWARGRYLSPVICETDGELVRGGRRLLITPGPRHARQGSVLTPIRWGVHWPMPLGVGVFFGSQTGRSRMRA